MSRFLCFTNRCEINFFLQFSRFSTTYISQTNVCLRSIKSFKTLVSALMLITMMIMNVKCIKAIIIGSAISAVESFIAHHRCKGCTNIILASLFCILVTGFHVPPTRISPLLMPAHCNLPAYMFITPSTRITNKPRSGVTLC